MATKESHDITPTSTVMPQDMKDQKAIAAQRARDQFISDARNATEKEHNMSLWQGIKLYPKAIAWSVLISTCIAMEGYDISLINNFYAFGTFNQKYGELLPDGKWEVPAPWQAGLSNVSAA